MTETKTDMEIHEAYAGVDKSEHLPLWPGQKLGVSVGQFCASKYFGIVITKMPGMTGSYYYDPSFRIEGDHYICMPGRLSYDVVWMRIEHLW